MCKFTVHVGLTHPEQGGCLSEKITLAFVCRSLARVEGPEDVRKGESLTGLERPLVSLLVQSLALLPAPDPKGRILLSLTDGHRRAAFSVIFPAFTPSREERPTPSLSLYRIQEERVPWEVGYCDHRQLHKQKQHRRGQGGRDQRRGLHLQSEILPGP